VAPHSFRRRWNGDLAPLMGPTPALAELMCSVEETARNAGYSVIFSNSKQTSATPATWCELSIARCSLLIRVLITDGRGVRPIDHTPVPDHLPGQDTCC